MKSVRSARRIFPVYLCCWADKSRHQILQWRFLWSEFDAVQFPPTEMHVEDLDFQLLETICRQTWKEEYKVV